MESSHFRSPTGGETRTTPRGVPSSRTDDRVRRIRSRTRHRGSRREPPKTGTGLLSIFDLAAVVTPNKKVVETYQTSLGNLDWDAVAGCLADDVERVEWADGFPTSGVPVRGKAAVVKDLEAPREFQIQATRLTEENDVVVAECVVRVPLEGGGQFVGQCCAVYELENGKIRRMSSFVAENKGSA